MQRLKKGNPMLGRFSQSSRTSPLPYLCGSAIFLATFFCGLLLSAHLVSAQVVAKREHINLAPSHQRISIQRAARRLPLARKSPRSEKLVAFADTTGPLRPTTQFEHPSQADFFAPQPESYRVPVNLNLLSPSTASSAGSRGTGGVLSAELMNARREFAADPVGRITSDREETANHIDDLEYYAHHVPVVGPLMQHVLNQSKAHPRLTHFFEVIQPQLF